MTNRNRKFKNHRLVTVETPERAAKKWGCQSLHYCKVSLQALGAGLDLYKITCKQHLFKQRTKEQRCCERKRLWGRNLMNKQPRREKCRWRLALLHKPTAIVLGFSEQNVMTKHTVMRLTLETAGPLVYHIFVVQKLLSKHLPAGRSFQSTF